MTEELLVPGAFYRAFPEGEVICETREWTSIGEFPADIAPALMSGYFWLGVGVALGLCILGAGIFGLGWALTMSHSAKDYERHDE